MKKKSITYFFKTLRKIMPTILCILIICDTTTQPHRIIFNEGQHEIGEDPARRVMRKVKFLIFEMPAISKEILNTLLLINAYWILCFSFNYASNKRSFLVAAQFTIILNNIFQH